LLGVHSSNHQPPNTLLQPTPTQPRFMTLPQLGAAELDR
jgi:hypothetical protein